MPYINPQFKYYPKSVPIPQAAPTESMPIINYKLQGKIAGIMQNKQFLPFTRGQQRAYAIQSFYNIGGGIQTGQSFNQPLISLTNTTE